VSMRWRSVPTAQRSPSATITPAPTCGTRPPGTWPPPSPTPTQKSTAPLRWRSAPTARRSPPATIPAAPTCGMWADRRPDSRGQTAGTAGSVPPFGDHGGADGGASGLVDEDQPAGLPVPAVGVAEQRLRRPEGGAADLVQPKLAGALLPVQGVHVQPVVRSSSSTRVTDMGG